jgi:predicted ATPase
VLVGRNGSGKTNLVDLLALVGEAMTLPLSTVIERRGGFSSIRNRISENSTIGVALELGACAAHVRNGRYAFEIGAVSGPGLEVLREQCRIDFVDGNHVWFERNGTNFTSNASGLAPSPSPAALILPIVGGDRRFAPVLQTLSDIRTFATLAPGRFQDTSELDDSSLVRSNGSNVVQVLHDLERSAPDSVERINEFLNATVDSMAVVRTKKSGDKVTLEFVQEWAQGRSLQLSPGQVSAGTLHILGVLLAVFQEPPPSVLILEEVDSRMHPDAIAVIADLIDLASRKMQVIITTHSPEMLDAASRFGDDSLRLLVWEAGASHIVPVAESVSHTLNSHLMGAGELLRSNALLPADFSQNDAIHDALFESLA